MALWIRVLAALAEDLYSVPSTHIRQFITISISRGSEAFSGLHGHQKHVWYIYIHAEKHSKTLKE